METLFFSLPLKKSKLFFIVFVNLCWFYFKQKSSLRIQKFPRYRTQQNKQNKRNKKNNRQEKRTHRLSFFLATKKISDQLNQTAEICKDLINCINDTDAESLMYQIVQKQIGNQKTFITGSRSHVIFQKIQQLRFCDNLVQNGSIIDSGHFFLRVCLTAKLSICPFVCLPV